MNREAVFNQLKIDEGVVYEIYEDHLGYATFGVGHLVLESDPEHGQPVGTPVSEERVRECFEKDLDTAISECTVLYGEAWIGFPGEVQEVLCVNLTVVAHDCLRIGLFVAGATPRVRVDDGVSFRRE